jgi:protein LTV1
MPRRKRPFIDRSRARTYEVVYRPLGDRSAGPERVLRAVPRGNASDARFADAGDAGDVLAYRAVERDVRGWEGDYVREREAYALGEYGLPDDGYDYVKHFKRMGDGTGAVFVERGGRTDAGGAGCDDVDAEESGAREVRREDERRKRVLLLEMKREREVDGDLDEVLAALEVSTDGETEGGDDAETDGEVDGPVAAGESGSELELDDDFIAKARGAPAAEEEDGGSAVGPPKVAAPPPPPPPPPRKARLLDEQFDELMRTYGEDGSSDGEDGDDEDEGEGDDEGDSDEGVEDGGGGAGSLDGKSVLDEGMLAALAADLPPGAARVDNDLDRAMEDLVGQYRRATVDETYTGPDSLRAPEALEGVRKAAARHFETGGDNSSRLPETDSKGNTVREVESEVDEADEEYAAAYETVIETRVADKWDCETVLSTYSNMDNHPSVIDDGPGGRWTSRPRRREPIVRLDPRTNMPVEFVPSPPEEEAAEDGEGPFFAERTNTAAAHVAARDRAETTAERRARKAAAKAAARERRAEKSATKKAFADEFKKQGHHEAKLGKSKVAVRF